MERPTETLRARVADNKKPPEGGFLMQQLKLIKQLYGF
jgi:hypothetical protein